MWNILPLFKDIRDEFRPSPLTAQKSGPVGHENNYINIYSKEKSHSDMTIYEFDLHSYLNKSTLTMLWTFFVDIYCNIWISLTFLPKQIYINNAKNFSGRSTLNWAPNPSTHTQSWSIHFIFRNYRSFFSSADANKFSLGKMAFLNMIQSYTLPRLFEILPKLPYLGISRN